MIYPYSSVWGWRHTAPIRTGLKVAVQPAGEQITLAEAKLHLRVDSYDSPPSHPDDALIETLIAAAREWVENDTGRALAPQTFELITSGFPAQQYAGTPERFTLPMAPIASVESVKYLDGAGVLTTMPSADWTLDNWSEPPWIYPASATTWPTVQATPNAITVRYQAGYTLPTDSPNNRPLPKLLKAAMLLVLGHLYENHEATTTLKLTEIPLGLDALLWRYRLRLGIA